MCFYNLANDCEIVLLILRTQIAFIKAKTSSNYFDLWEREPSWLEEEGAFERALDTHMKVVIWSIEFEFV
jgi:hypothetical protein